MNSKIQESCALPSKFVGSTDNSRKTLDNEFNLNSSRTVSDGTVSVRDYVSNFESSAKTLQLSPGDHGGIEDEVRDLRGSCGGENENTGSRNELLLNVLLGKKQGIKTRPPDTGQKSDTG